MIFVQFPRSAVYSWIWNVCSCRLIFVKYQDSVHIKSCVKSFECHSLNCCIILKFFVFFQIRSSFYFNSTKCHFLSSWLCTFKVYVFKSFQNVYVNALEKEQINFFHSSGKSDVAENKFGGYLVRFLGSFETEKYKNYFQTAEWSRKIEKERRKEGKKEKEWMNE